MPDHVWDIGGGAQMMIRDLGVSNGHVEFWFRARATAWNRSQPWGYNAGWGYQQGTFNLKTGGLWHHLGTVFVPTGRNVTMRMLGEGLGWPTTDRVVWIPRTSVPPAPTIHSATALSPTDIQVHFTGNGDGGTPVREWQIAYGRNPHVAEFYTGSNGNTTITVFIPTLWYFWARGRNDVGWGPWSARAQAHAWRVPDPPTKVVVTNVTQSSVTTRFEGIFDGGAPIIEWQLSYGETGNPDMDNFVWSNGTNQLYNLNPGRMHFFQARGRNAVGWGPWSEIAVETLRAGAMVKDGPVWRRAVPYVKVNGVWRLAKPYVKRDAFWMEVR